MTLVQVQRRPRGTSTWIEIEDFVSWKCIPKTLDMTVPTAQIILSNRNGRYSTKIRSRDEFRILVDRGQFFHGKLKGDTRKIGDQLLEVTAEHIDYVTCKDKLCSDAYKQLGYSGWKWGSATQIGKTQTGGLRPDEVFRAGLGTRFHVQTYFESTAVVKSFDKMSIEEGAVTLSREVVSGVEKYVAQGNITLSDWYNTLTGYDEMPDIGNVTITLVGVQPTGTSLSLDLSRNSGSNVITKVPVYSSGVWTVSVSSGEWAATSVRNRLSVKITGFANGSQTETPLIQSVSCEGDIRNGAGKGDMGLAEGIIDVYIDPDGAVDEIGGDFSRQNRLQVLQGAAKGAVGDASEEYPSWFAYIDDGVGHFRNPANFGTDKSNTIIFGRELGTCEDIKVETYGDSIINNLMYIGQGLPPYGEITLTANDLTGLKNAASIAVYGEIQGTVQEKGIPSITFADKRARILAKHLSQPQISYEIVNPDINLVSKIQLGDRVGIQETRHNIDASFILLEKSYEYDNEEGLRVAIKVSNNKVTGRNFIAQLGQQQEAQNLIGQGSMSPPALSFQGNLDKDHPIELPFWLPRGKTVRRIGGYFKSSKFRANSRAINISGITIENEGEHTHNMPHSHNVEGRAHSHAVTSKTSTANVSPILSTHTFSHTFTSASSPEGTVLFNSSPDISLANTEAIAMYVTIRPTKTTTANDADVWLLIEADTDAGANLADLFSDHIQFRSFNWSGQMEPYKKYFLLHKDMTDFSLSTIPSIRFRLRNFGTTQDITVTLRLEIIGDHDHTVSGQTASTTTPASVTSGPSSVATTAAGSQHTHSFSGGTADIDFGIFEPDEYPEGVQLYIKDYPTPGVSNQNENNLNAAFGPFGTRGTEDNPFEVENIDLSAGFRDNSGNFKTGQLHKIWLKSSASVDNAEGLGRLFASLFIELMEGTDADN